MRIQYSDVDKQSAFFLDTTVMDHENQNPPKYLGYSLDGHSESIVTVTAGRIETSVRCQHVCQGTCRCELWPVASGCMYDLVYCFLGVVVFGQLFVLAVVSFLYFRCRST